jgi:hypothetical protein
MIELGVWVREVTVKENAQNSGRDILADEGVFMGCEHWGHSRLEEGSEDNRPSFRQVESGEPQ